MFWSRLVPLTLSGLSSKDWRAARRIFASTGKAASEIRAFGLGALLAMAGAAAAANAAGIAQGGSGTMQPPPIILNPFSRPAGFGSATTGGDPGNVCIAHALETLRLCAGDQHSLVVKIIGNPTILTDSRILVASNKTIVGPATIIGPGSGSIFDLVSVSNVILRDLTLSERLSGPCANAASPTQVKGCGVPIFIQGSTKDVWIDHIDAGFCGEKCIEIWNLGMGNNNAPPDSITISYVSIHDTYFGMAVGIDSQARGPLGPERVTIYGSKFRNVFRRSIRAASYAWVHQFNNVIDGWGKTTSDCLGGNYAFGPSTTGQAQLLLENNVFIPTPGSPCVQPVNVADYEPTIGFSRGIGYASATGNISPVPLLESAHLNVFRAPYPYMLLPASSVAAMVAANAGTTAPFPAAGSFQALSN